MVAGQVISDVDHRNLNTDVPWPEGARPDGGDTWPGLLGAARAGAPRRDAADGPGMETDKNWAEVGDRA